MKHYKSFFAFLIFLLFIHNAIFSQNSNISLPEDYNTLEYFQVYKSSEYDFAVEQSKKLYKSLKKKKYPHAKEVAVMVFPELIHYSQYQDAIEKLFNDLLSTVTEESNIFSIGIFQMKPVFAIKIEEMLEREPELAKKYKDIRFCGKSNKISERKARIERLSTYKYQLQYLMAFADYKIKDLNLEKEDLETRVKYLATAYNSGFDNDRVKLNKYIRLDNYPLKNKLYTNYSRICLDALQLFK